MGIYRNNNNMLNNFKGSVPEFGAKYGAKTDSKKDSLIFFPEKILQHTISTYTNVRGLVPMVKLLEDATGNNLEPIFPGDNTTR